MTQNIYDQADFFAGYSQLPRSLHGLDGAPEWPDLQAMLPDLKGKRVLDLGCGFGWFCRWAADQGAAEVFGLDVSENMLTRARSETSSAAVRYERADLETVAIQPAAYDLIYSSLALHYLVDLARLTAEVRRGLASGGAFVFSVEHPIVTCSTHQQFIADAEGRKHWPVSGYLSEGRRVTDWLAKGVVKQHRTLATYLNLLTNNGLSLTQIKEWGPTAAQIAAKPAWAVERERPMFLLVSARAP